MLGRICKNMGKTKVISEAQNQKLAYARKYYPWLKIISHEEFCQLNYPEIFPVSNKPRLYKNVQNNTETFLSSFHYAFQNLPFSYQDKIVLSTNFKYVLDTLLKRLEFVDKTKKKDSVEKENHSYQIYQKFFNIGLEGLIRTMPQEFEPYLKSQIKPLLLLMLSIAKFSKSIDPDLIPNLSFPNFVFSDRELSPMGPF